MRNEKTLNMKPIYLFLITLSSFLLSSCFGGSKPDAKVMHETLRLSDGSETDYLLKLDIPNVLLKVTSGGYTAVFRESQCFTEESGDLDVMLYSIKLRLTDYYVTETKTRCEPVGAKKGYEEILTDATLSFDRLNNEYTFCIEDTPVPQLHSAICHGASADKDLIVAISHPESTSSLIPSNETMTNWTKVYGKWIFYVSDWMWLWLLVMIPIVWWHGRLFSGLLIGVLMFYSFYANWDIGLWAVPVIFVGYPLLYLPFVSKDISTTLLLLVGLLVAGYDVVQMWKAYAFFSFLWNCVYVGFFSFGFVIFLLLELGAKCDKCGRMTGRLSAPEGGTGCIYCQ